MAFLVSTGIGSGTALAASTSPNIPGFSEIDSFIANSGPTFIANQQKLSDFKHWVALVPGIEEAGYVEQVNDAENLSTKILWKGPSRLRETVLAEGLSRGIITTFSERPYSLPQIRTAITKIDAQSKVLAELGFQIDGIAGVRDDDGAIAIEGHPLDQLTPNLSKVSEIVQLAAGGPVRVTDNRRTTPATATRSNDTAPFDSGGYMIESGHVCSTGFSLADSRRTYAVTARHCPQGSYYDRDNPGVYVGYELRDSPDGQASLLDGTGSKWMFDGVWNNSAGYAKGVSGFQDVALGDRVCTSGGNSGVHCNIKIIGMNYWWNDGYGGANTIEAYQQTAGQIATIQGDSGGPVLMPLSNGTVGAVGMIQAVITGHTTGCGSVHDQGGEPLLSRHAVHFNPDYRQQPRHESGHLVNDLLRNPDELSQNSALFEPATP
ncbi:hypothetical protein FHU41_000104 [Psychromicrobium silvestre]|uniref:Trypsin n=1 Tax=Psychromicrobium silvestre TaxID=1645614 RepID=A0A7Y9LQT4_9MICC|nr:hypothetical protein [Psychromicrobium silvestre]NYE93883.1 hypothetical protein [Psychromicrobium silvestre]